MASLLPRRSGFSRSAHLVVGGLGAAALVLGACGSGETPEADSVATQPPSPTEEARELVRRELDASLGVTGYELLIVMSDGPDVASVHRASDAAGAYEMLTTYRIEAGRLERAARYRSTQKLGTGPDTAVYASNGNPDPANRQRVLTMYHDVIDLRQPDAPARYIAETYIQHNPMVPQGRAGIEGFIRGMGPATGPTTRKESLVIADGELVLMVSEFGGGRRIADLFRVEEGMIAEHWDFTPVL